MANPDNYNRLSGDTPYNSEYENFVNKYTGRGSLKVQASMGKEALPVEDVFVDVAIVYNGTRYTIYHDVTDSSGIISEIILPALLNSITQNPETASESGPTYLVSAYHPGFDEIVDSPVTIYDQIETILPLNLNTSNGGLEGE